MSSLLLRNNSALFVNENNPGYGSLGARVEHLTDEGAHVRPRLYSGIRQ
jgi:hypothetical protein